MPNLLTPQSRRPRHRAQPMTSRRFMHRFAKRTHTRGKASYRLQTVLLFALFLTFFIFYRIHQGSQEVVAPDEQCFLLTSKSSPIYLGVPFNSKALCASTKPICVAPGRIFTDTRESDVQCDTRTPSFHTLPRHFNCSSIRRYVHSGHGTYPDGTGEHARPAAIAPLAKAMSNSTWLDIPTVFIPAFPYYPNIFHWMQTLGPVALAMETLPKLLPSSSSEASGGRRKIAFVFGAEHMKELGWHEFASKALIKRAQALNIEPQVHYMNISMMPTTSHAPQPAVCANQSVVLGQRGATCAFPYASSDGFDHDQRKIVLDFVPAESLAWRAATYSLAGVKSNLLNLIKGNRDAPVMALTDLPPLVIGYARRNIDPDLPPGVPMVNSTNVRRLSDADEAWLINLMRNEAKRVGAAFRTVQVIPGMQTPEEQVRMFASVGVIVGLHGANLVNSIFAPPFATLVEMINWEMGCYSAGMNSGLSSWRFQATRTATPEESSCVPPGDHWWLRDCMFRKNQRRVIISDHQAHTTISRIIRQAVDRVVHLRKSFEHLNGIPIEYDAATGSYRIIWRLAHK